MKHGRLFLQQREAKESVSRSKKGDASSFFEVGREQVQDTIVPVSTNNKTVWGPSMYSMASRYNRLGLSHARVFFGWETDFCFIAINQKENFPSDNSNGSLSISPSSEASFTLLE